MKLFPNSREQCSTLSINFCSKSHSEYLEFFRTSSKFNNKRLYNCVLGLFENLSCFRHFQYSLWVASVVGKPDGELARLLNDVVVGHHVSVGIDNKTRSKGPAVLRLGHGRNADPRYSRSLAEPAWPEKEFEKVNRHRTGYGLTGCYVDCSRLNRCV